MKYRLFDHTADYGVEVFGSDVRTLFENAASAMFDLALDLRTVNGNLVHRIESEGSDWPDLMVNWLRDLLYLWSGKGMMVKSATIEAISEFRIAAVAGYDLFDPVRHRIRKEIKAVTYHQIEVREESTGWTARVIFDV